MDNITRLYWIDCPYCHHAIDLATELEMFNTQRKRYKNMPDGYKTRIKELQTELDIL